MQNNDIQISAIRYVGTDLTSSLGLKEFSKDPQEAFDLVKNGVAEKFDQLWFPSYGFDNTYIFTVRKDVAEKYNLHKISDLAAHAKEMNNREICPHPPILQAVASSTLAARLALICAKKYLPRYRM